jgi:prephenate dehydrogenase
MATEQFKVAVIGLGLMGGSFALALKGFKNGLIIGYDRNGAIKGEALAYGVIQKAADSLGSAVKEADLILLCTYPNTIVRDIRRCAGLLKKNAVITDICGVKQPLLADLPPDYIGLHPMAGKETDGLANAQADMFQNAGFILIPQDQCRQESINLLRELAVYVGAGSVCLNSAEEHDRIIAYTSDLMHIAAAALCVKYPADMTMTHTAGAFRDCTRVASLNADLWTDLLLLNRKNVIPALEEYIAGLSRFKEALLDENRSFIHDFLETASNNKKNMQTL